MPQALAGLDQIPRTIEHGSRFADCHEAASSARDAEIDHWQHPIEGHAAASCLRISAQAGSRSSCSIALALSAGTSGGFVCWRARMVAAVASRVCATPFVKLAPARATERLSG